MVWLFQRLHSNTSPSTGAPAQALGQPGGFGGQGRITEVLQPCPPHKRASGQLQTELPTELVSFLQCPGPAGSGLQLCWLHFVYLKLKTRTGAWWPQLSVTADSPTGQQSCSMSLQGTQGSPCRSSCCCQAGAGGAAGHWLGQCPGRALGCQRGWVRVLGVTTSTAGRSTGLPLSRGALWGSTAQGCTSNAAAVQGREGGCRTDPAASAAASVPWARSAAVCVSSQQSPLLQGCCSSFLTVFKAFSPLSARLRVSSLSQGLGGSEPRQLICCSAGGAGVGLTGWRGESTRCHRESLYRWCVCLSRSVFPLTVFPPTQNGGKSILISRQQQVLGKQHAGHGSRGERKAEKRSGLSW